MADTTYKFGDGSEFTAGGSQIKAPTGTKSLTSDLAGSTAATTKSLTDISGKIASEVGNFDYAGEKQSIMDTYKTRQQKATEAGQAERDLIASKAGTQIDTATEQAQRDLTANQEAQRGFSVNPAQMRFVEETGRRRILDLEKARDELTLQSKANEANRIDGLIEQEQTAITNARTSYINELFGASSQLRDTATFNANNEDRIQKFNDENSITGTYFQQGNIIYNSQTHEPAYRKVGDEFQSMDGQKKFANSSDFFKDAGINSFQEISSPQKKLTKDDLFGSDTLGYFKLDANGSPQQILKGTGPGYNAIKLDDGTVLFSDPTNPANTQIYNPDTQQLTGVGSGGINIPTGTLASKNNNPGNLRFVGQAGASQGVGGFAKFDSPEAGYQALVSQINLDAGRGLTLGQFINKYAPPSENNTSQYLSQAISATGANANTKIGDINVDTLAQFMAKKESGTTIGSTNSQSQGDTAVNDAFKFLSPNLTDAQRKSATAALKSFGNDSTKAADFVLTTAISALPTADLKNAAYGRQSAIAALGDIQSLLSQFQAKGGDTNLLTGSIEKISQKVGATSNPDLAYLGNQIVQAMVDYRRSVSGAAFTESESKVYENLFPSIGNVPALNAAKVQSLKDIFNRNQKVTMETILGSNNYDNLQKIKIGSFIDSLGIIGTNSSPSRDLGPPVNISIGNTKGLTF